jgi:hypothetical protein
MTQRTKRRIFDLAMLFVAIFLGNQSSIRNFHSWYDLVVCLFFYIGYRFTSDVIADKLFPKEIK